MLLENELKEETSRQIEENRYILNTVLGEKVMAINYKIWPKCRVEPIFKIIWWVNYHE